MVRIGLIPASLLATAATAAVPQHVSISPGPLADALQQLAQQTGLSVAVDDPVLWHRRVAGLNGRMAPETALRRLLASIAASPVRLGPNVWKAVAQARPAPARPTPQPAIQPAAPGEPTEIVVEGSKRDVRLSRYPGQVELIDGRRLATDGERGTESIVSRLSSLSSTYLGAGRNKLFIRGIADSSFTGPTQGTVGQYLGDIRLVYNAPDPDLRLYDMRSVEVLEGPQGTLYGAGSLGGIVRLVPNAPDPGQAGGFVARGLSATQHGALGADAGGWANLPVGDRSAIRLVGYTISESGYIDDVQRGKRDINRTTISGGRANFLFAPTDNWQVQVGGVFQRTHGRDSQYADRGLPPLERASPTAGGFDARYGLASLVISKSWADLNFLSSSGLIRHRLTERYDATLEGEEPRVFVQRNRTDMFTSENRLWRPLRNGYGWVVGLSYTHNRTTLGRALGPVAAPVPTTGVANAISELTGFAEGSVERSIFTFTAGLRFTHDRLAGTAEDVPESTFRLLALSGTTAIRWEDKVIPSASVSARLSSGSIAFLRYQEGRRPGGLAIEADLVRRFRGDHVRSIEGGLQFGNEAGALLGGAISASYAYWSDIQADYVDGTGLPSTSNVGDGRIYSISGSLRIRPQRHLQIELGSTYNSSRVTDPSVSFVQALTNAARFRAPGTLQVSASEPLGRIPNVARLTARGSVRYEAELDAGLEGSIEAWSRYVGRSRLGVGPVLGDSQGDYAETGLTARLVRGDTGLTISVTNLFDAVGNRFALGTPFARELDQVTPLRPRTIRVGLDRAF